MVARLGFLRNRVQKRDVEFGSEDFQRNPGKSPTGADIENSAVEFFEIQEYRAVCEMLGNYAFTVADGGKVGVRIVREERIGETFEKRRLVGRRFYAELGKNFGNHWGCLVTSEAIRPNFPTYGKRASPWLWARIRQ